MAMMSCHCCSRSSCGSAWGRGGARGGAREAARGGARGGARGKPCDVEGASSLAVPISGATTGAGNYQHKAILCDLVRLLPHKNNTLHALIGHYACGGLWFVLFTSDSSPKGKVASSSLRHS